MKVKFRHGITTVDLGDVYLEDDTVKMNCMDIETTMFLSRPIEWKNSDGRTYTITPKMGSLFLKALVYKLNTDTRFKQISTVIEDRDSWLTRTA